jgi:hypothetical protein
VLCVKIGECMVERFRESFQKLREKWDFTIEFEREVWKKTRALSEEQFEALCNALLEREFPPVVDDFATNLPVVDTSLDRKRTTPTPHVEYKFRPCSVCDDGIVFAEQVRTKAVYTFKCTCELGARVRQSLPDWRADLIEVFTPVTKKQPRV